jgi:hypothetical protein
MATCIYSDTSGILQYLALSGLFGEGVRSTQGCASLHPGLSNIGLSGLKNKK